MKELLFFCIVVFLNNLYGQNSKIAIEFPDYKILYRNYPNKILIPSNGINNFDVKGQNINIIRTDIADEYIIVPQCGKEATIYILSKNRRGYDTIRKTTYLVKNFPNPVLYWGNFKNSEEADIKEEKIYVKFNEDVPLVSNFKIKSWILKFDSLYVCGEGNNISTAKDFLLTINKPTNINIEVIIYHPLSEESLMKIEGTWNVLPWKTEIEQK